LAHILEHLTARRSIRRYTDEPVSHDDVQALLEAAMSAPSASNRKPWEFVVVDDADRLDRLRRGMVFGRYGAPLAIVVCADMLRCYPPPAQGFWIQDCSAATQNILLAATGLGLGSVWLGVHPLAPMIAHVRSVVHLPRHVRPLGVVYIGHPAEEKPPRTQYDASRVRWQEYGPAPAVRRWWQFWRREGGGGEGA
jgi:nitroreductase